METTMWITFFLPVFELLQVFSLKHFDFDERSLFVHSSFPYFVQILPFCQYQSSRFFSFSRLISNTTTFCVRYLRLMKEGKKLVLYFGSLAFVRHVLFSSTIWHFSFLSVPFFFSLALFAHSKRIRFPHLRTYDLPFIVWMVQFLFSIRNNIHFFVPNFT